jgi:hypothetical protein
MRFGVKRVERDTDYAQTMTFVEKCKKVASAFSRKRKLVLFALLMTMLQRKGLTLSMEIRGFTQMNIIEGVSKVAYLKQRQRLNPAALLDLCQFHNRGLYDDGEMKDYKGYLLLAADGSAVNVPTTPETLAEYGTSSRKGTKPQAALGLSCLYDVINKTILTCTINRNKFNETTEAEKHIAELPQLVGERKSVLILDRGYPSLPFLLKLENQQQKYVVRLSGTDLKKEQLSLKSNDELVEVIIDRTRLAHYKGKPEYDLLTNAGSITLRMVKIPLEPGGFEYLATNLYSDEFSADEIGNIYTARWGIETAFGILKNKLALENFTGTKPILIEQDIYSSIYICNLAQDMISDAETELAADSVDSTPRKHPMAVNKSFAIGILKELLIRAVLTDDQELKTALFREMLAEVKRELLPVRPGRHFNRTKGVLHGKYSNSHKRSF